MEKVYSLNSAKASSPFALQRPRSLKYYLSAGLHHKIVGKFATGVYFYEPSVGSTEPEAKVASAGSRKTKHSKKKKNPYSVNADPKKAESKKPRANRTFAGVSGTSESGPIANYAHSSNNPDLTKEMVKISNEILASARTVFPIDPFPDTIVLDRTTLNITKRTFFFSNDTLSIRIEDILNAHVNVGPFLGSLTIASRVLSSEDHFTVTNLWRNDAIHLKHMIQGYVIALHNEIEISHLSREELVETISELGHDLNS